MCPPQGPQPAQRAGGRSHHGGYSRTSQERSLRDRSVTTAMQPTPAVSVIVPARDSGPTLARTLTALDKQDVSVPYEVVVVDDGSQDDTAAIAGRHSPRVTLVRNERSLGPGGARNRGVERSRGAVLAFTDADCYPTRAWLSKGLEAMENFDLVQGRVDPDPQVPRTPFDRSLAVHGDAGFYQTANLFVRREVFTMIGGFRDWALEEPQR